MTHDRFEERFYVATDVGSDSTNRDKSWKEKALSKAWSLETET